MQLLLKGLWGWGKTTEKQTGPKCLRVWVWMHIWHLLKQLEHPLPASCALLAAPAWAGPSKAVSLLCWSVSNICTPQTSPECVFPSQTHPAFRHSPKSLLNQGSSLADAPRERQSSDRCSLCRLQTLITINGLFRQQISTVPVGEVMV